MNPTDKHKLVLIHWQDIFADVTWTTAPDVKPSECYSTGWLIDRDDYVILASDLMLNGTVQYNSISAIPKGCIKSITEIK